MMVFVWIYFKINNYDGFCDIFLVCLGL